MYTKIKLTLQLESSVDDYSPLNKSTHQIYERYINQTKSIVENPEQVEIYASKPELLSRFSPAYTCVIITNSELEPEFQALAEWNKKRGYWTEIVTKEWINNN